MGNTLNSQEIEKIKENMDSEISSVSEEITNMRKNIENLQKITLKQGEMIVYLLENKNTRTIKLTNSTKIQQ